MTARGTKRAARQRPGKAGPATRAAGGGESSIRVERDGSIAVVTLDRPGRRNAMTLAMWQTLGRLFRDLAGDAALRAVILTGAGGDFCAGADIGEFGKVRSSLDQGRVYGQAVDACMAAIADLPKPVIAAITGFCLGGGCGLALACDFRFAAADAQFAIPAARLGIVYSLRETGTLFATVGLAAAKRILFAAERLDAAEAACIGLIDRRVDGSALDAARSFAAVMAENAPLSIAGAKAILTALGRGERIGREHASAWSQAALESEDYREGVRAFAEKRRPRFKGR